MKYCPGGPPKAARLIPNFWITNGAEWYITYGDTTDWSYGALGIPDFTLEVSEQKQPSSSEIPNLISYHIPAMLDFVEWPNILYAQVLDAQTLQGIPAQISIQSQ